MWSLSKSDSGGESAFGGGGFRRWHGESKCPMEFTMIETFISEGEEWNSLRSDKTFHSCLGFSGSALKLERIKAPMT